VSATADEVRERLNAAHRREDDLVALNGGDLPSADAHLRQQLVQEFFFHVVGAIEVLAQHVNDARSLSLSVEDVTPSAVARKLPSGDPLQVALDDLYRNTRPGKPIPPDLYSDEGVLYRIWNYRHQVTHRGRQPFQFNVGIGTAIDFSKGVRGLWRKWQHKRRPDPTTLNPEPTAHFILDPRDPPGVRNASKMGVPDELQRMRELVTIRCEAALRLV
jgi:hypothetical protein